MTLVNPETGEIVVATAEEARALTDRIKVAIEGSWLLVKEAYERRAWVSLGYGGWDEYCTREFGSSRLKLPREERQEVVASLRESGLSVRAIAAATGLARETVRQEITGDQKRSPEPPTENPIVKQGREMSQRPHPGPITGTDGKKYSPSPSPGVQAARERRAAEAAAKEGNVDTPARGTLAATEARREAVERMSAEGQTSRQIAAHLNISIDGLYDWRRRNGVADPPADAVVGKSRRHDSDRIVTEVVNALDGLAMSTDLVAFDDLDTDQIAGWATSLTDSLRTLQKFHKQIKEMAQ